MTIAAFILDVDGVLTDGQVTYSADGEVLKAFSAQDGLGLKLLAKAGVKLAVLSGRDSAPLRRRLDDLGITHRILGSRDKLSALRDLLDALGVRADDTAYMGDDLVDLAVMQTVGTPLAPANAVIAVKAAAKLVTVASGGHGAVREACEWIAAERGQSLSDIYFGETTDAASSGDTPAREISG